jgi:hypothetical protein
MTEEFENMLPLTHEQRELLKMNNDCELCPLSHQNTGCESYIMTCSVFTTGSWCECAEARAEALRLDDEYRKENMKKDILHTIVDPDEPSETGECVIMRCDDD